MTSGWQGMPSARASVCSRRVTAADSTGDMPAYNQYVQKPIEVCFASKGISSIMVGR